MHVITLAHREQGILVAQGNPHQIKGIEDIEREDLIFINRKKGSGTRLWLDQQILSLDFDTDRIQGYGLRR